MSEVTAKPKRKYVTDAKLEEAMLRDRLEHPNRKPKETCGFRPNDERIVHPKFGPTVTIETRTGTGVTTRTVPRSRAFKVGDGVIRQTKAQCNPDVFRCTDAFYGQIDADLRKWRFEEDLKLRVPYAVKIMRHRRQMRAIKRRYAIERGLV